MKMRLPNLALVLAASLLGGCAGQLKAHGTVVDQPAPEIRLHEAGGTSFALSEQRGKTSIVFFGYTHCGDVCPTTLAHLAQAIARLKGSDAKFQTVFVTVDPMRDTPAVVAKYAKNFDPSFIGLSGSASELANLEKQYHIWAKAMPADKHGNYEVAHSSEFFVISPRGRVRVLEDWDIPITDLAEDLAAVAREHA